MARIEGRGGTPKWGRDARSDGDLGKFSHTANRSVVLESQVCTWCNPMSKGTSLLLCSYC